MDETFMSNCKDLAVRIGLNEGRFLLGSGVVLAPGHRKYALILTAAHLFDRLNPENDGRLHIFFMGNKNPLQMVNLDYCRKMEFAELTDRETAHLYIHPDYKIKSEGYPEYDAAVLQIPFFPWMASLPEFQLVGTRKIENPFLVGFPSKDNASQNDPHYKRKVNFVSFEGDIFSKEVELIDQHNTNLVVRKVYKDSSPWNTGNEKLDGLSGGGIFSQVRQGIVFNGAFAMTKIAGEDSYYATEGGVFVDMLQRFGVSFVDPPQIDRIRKEALSLFREEDDNGSYRWFQKESKDYIGGLDGDLFLEDSLIKTDALPCPESRALCPTFYAGKLIGSVLFSSLYGISPADVNDQVVEIDGDQVHLSHICSEVCVEMVVQEAFLRQGYSAHGPFKNKSIFVVNGKNPLATRLVKRARCHKIIWKVLGRMPEEFKYSEDYSCVSELISDESKANEFPTFDIIQGDLAQAQMAFLPLRYLEEYMYNDLPDMDDLKDDVDTLLAQVWEDKQECQQKTTN